MPYAKIIGTGSYVPERVLTNDDLSRMLGENIAGSFGVRLRAKCEWLTTTVKPSLEAMHAQDIRLSVRPRRRRTELSFGDEQSRTTYHFPAMRLTDIGNAFNMPLFSPNLQPLPSAEMSAVECRA